MPIYEFYCSNCNRIFNFYSRRVDTSTSPDCPRCGKAELDRRISSFALIGSKRERADDDPVTGIDEAKMERAMASLMREAESINHDDPRQMADLMRKFSDKAGVRLGDAMEQAISRLEAGEDPDVVEREMGEQFEGEEAFGFDALKKKTSNAWTRPLYDENLYELDQTSAKPNR